MAQRLAADDRRMPLVGHLAELRRVLIIATSAWAAGTVIAFLFRGLLFSVLLRPLDLALAHAGHLVPNAVFFAPTEGLTVPLKLAAITGLLLALPVIAWQLWSFVSPGLRPQERRLALPLAISALVLFALGAGFAYFVLPVGLGFLATFLGGEATYVPDINEYLSFFLLLVVVFGAAFELPVVLVTLGLARVVSSAMLKRRRGAIYLAIVFLALIVTPGGDPFTPMALGLPLAGLFEASLLILGRLGR